MAVAHLSIACSCSFIQLFQFVNYKNHSEIFLHLQSALYVGPLFPISQFRQFLKVEGILKFFITFIQQPAGCYLERFF